MQAVNLSRNATDVIEIPVNQLGISVPHLVRPIDEQYVAELVETDETEWEPIEVRLWPPEWSKPTPDVFYHVVSGNHRTSAAQIKGLHTLRARRIEAASDLDYLLAAIRTNARHGRNFKEDERRLLAAQLKGLGQSADQIAKLFGVNRATVYNWLSGRDSNVSKKKASGAREQAKDTLANLGLEGLSEEWRSLPLISADARKLAKVGQTINDFLAETPLAEDKAHIVAWTRSLTKEARQSVSLDMRETVQWLINVSTLLQQEG